MNGKKYMNIRIQHVSRCRDWEKCRLRNKMKVKGENKEKSKETISVHRKQSWHLERATENQRRPDKGTAGKSPKGQ